jgi:hypothetical protein
MLPRAHRLTSAPDPATVRPEGVLRAAYERLVRLIRSGEQGYFYALDQFKGMRQDCTVQHLRTDLTVRNFAAQPPGVGGVVLPLLITSLLLLGAAAVRLRGDCAGWQHSCWPD